MTTPLTVPGLPDRMVGKRERDRGKAIWDNIKERENDLEKLFARMDEDLPRWKMDKWIPDEEETIKAEDAYTTNQMRVVAEKIISFVSSTELVTRVPNDFADNQQEVINDKTEQLAIGVLNNADKRLRRAGKQSVQDQLAFYTVVRGGWAIVRAQLRKSFAGQTESDILPIDPRHFVFQGDDTEFNWAAHRMVMSRKDIMRKYPGFRFDDMRETESSTGEEVWEYVERIQNPTFNPVSANPFDAHPWLYQAGTLVDGVWARKMHRLFCFMFPIIAIPVSEQPILTPANDRNDKFAEIESFGESIFADMRFVAEFYQRLMSYNMTMAARAADPRQKISSLDGTKELGEGANEKGAEIQLSTANQENVENMDEAEAKIASQLASQGVNIDMVAGGLPPQSIGLLDKPLSGVALSQLGQNIEQKVVPRMKAVSQAIESALELMVGQYETGAFEPFTVSGTRSSLVRFANQRIGPEEILGHDPVEVTMELALPEDETTRWTVAHMALQPIAPNGETLMSLEWVREKILKIQSPKVVERQNIERLANSSIPVAQAWQILQTALHEGDQLLASAAYDQLRVAILQQQVSASVQLQQLGLIAQGIPLDATAVDQAIQRQAQSEGGFAGNGNNQAANPANGAVPFAALTGVGNQPSPEAGFNTTAPRQRDTGLISPNGEPLLAT